MHPERGYTPDGNIPTSTIATYSCYAGYDLPTGSAAICFDGNTITQVGSKIRYTKSTGKKMSINLT